VKDGGQSCVLAVDSDADGLPVSVKTVGATQSRGVLKLWFVIWNYFLCFFEFEKKKIEIVLRSYYNQGETY